MRLVEVYGLEQWTGGKDTEGWVLVPEDLDLKQCEDAWFKVRDKWQLSFCDYLVSHCGCQVAAEPEAWCINYM